MNFVKEIVGSVRISLEKDEMRQNIYPDTLDIGLNITDYNNPNIE